MSKRKVKALGPSCPVHGGLARDKDGNVLHIRKVAEGENVTGKHLVNVGPVDENGEQEIETLYDGRPSAPESSGDRRGPAQYATAASRATWDRVFGNKKRSEAN